MTGFKTLVFTILVPGTVLLYVPYKIGSFSALTLQLEAFHYFAILPWTIGGTTYAWCAWDFTFKGRGTPAPIDPPKELVARGLYCFVRNPMYLGGLLIVLGHFLWFQSLWLLLYAGGLFLMFHFFVVLYEEPTLRKSFGESYVRYCQSVPRWALRFRG